MTFFQPWSEVTPDNRKVIFYMTAFVGTHTIFSHGKMRERLIAKLTLSNYINGYTLVGLATLFPALYIYLRKTKNTGDAIPFIQQHQDLCFGIGVFLKLLALQFIPLYGTGAQPALIGLTEKEKQQLAARPVRGVMKITRHSLFWMLNFLSLGLILTNGTYSDLYFNGFIIAEGLLGSLHQDHRHRSANNLQKEFFEQSTWFPNFFNYPSTFKDISWDRVFAQIGFATVGFLYYTGKLDFSKFRAKN